MPQDNPRTRRSILRTSGKTLAAATAGVATVGNVSADEHFDWGVRVTVEADGNIPAYKADNPCGDYDYWYEMPPGSEAYCKGPDEEFSCGTFVEVNDLDFSVLSWVNTRFLEVVG